MSDAQALDLPVVDPSELRTPRIHSSGERVVEIDDVTVSYGAVTVLIDVSFHVLRGEFLCLLGPNGSGKSTLLRAMLGLVEPAGGEIRVLGKPPGTFPKRVGYVPQLKSYNRNFPATAVELIVANLRGSWPVRITAEERDLAEKALARVNGSELARLPLQALSGGQSQRVFLARALATEPELLLLDEPEAGVDARGRAELYELLSEVAHDDYLSAVMVTHSQVAINMTAEKVAFIDGTLQAFGLPIELFGQGRLSQLTVHHEAESD